MTRTKLASGLTLAVLSFIMFGTPALEGQSARQRILIRTPRPYTSVENTITSSGGRVTHRFRKIDVVAAEVSEAGLRQLRATLPAGAISKDEIVAAPAPIRELEGRGGAQAGEEATDVSGLDAAGLQAFAIENPTAYIVNNAITGVNVLHSAGFAGQGMTVAVIDSGIRPGFPHLTLDGSVVGCEDFVLDALGCSNFANEGHGTFVAGQISANVNFTFATGSLLRNAVLIHAPGAFTNPPTNTRIPMIGSAPLSSIYALRVFGATGGSPTSRILQAIERTIELRELFNAGTPGGANIKVVNMSLGGSTIYAGRDLFDRMVNELLFADIVPVIAASNNGPALVTTGSPGTAFSALTVGAASFAHNERILRELQLVPAGFPLGFGSLYRPFNPTQTAYLSSRGPNANGRPDPDVMATGFANYGQGTGGTVNTVSIGSGTSFASPSVAGLAAILRQAFPAASALKVRNAIIAGANDAIIADGSSQYDQGQGMIDAVASYNLLLNNQAPHSFIKPYKFWWLWWFSTPNVAVNLELAGLDVQKGHVSENSGLLLPGQHHSILYNVKPGTASVTIEIANFQQTAPGSGLFLNDIILAVHSAKTSAIGAEGDYPFFEFTTGGTFTVTDPEPGIMRITLYGDWTNSTTVSVDADVTSVMEGLPKLSVAGDVRGGETDSYTLTVPAGAASLEFLLRWQDDWSRYPGADLDLILTSPTSAMNFAGATLNSPERATIAAPAAGTWTIDVDGFEIHRHKEEYKLTVMLNGQVVKLKKK